MKGPVTIYQRMGKGVDENIFFRGNTWFSGGTWRGLVVAEGGGGGCKEGIKRMLCSL